MAEFILKINPEQRSAYIPKEIYKVLGSRLAAVTSRTAVVLFPENMPIEDVLKSLELIQLDLQYALKLKQKEEEQKKD